MKSRSCKVKSAYVKFILLLVFMIGQNVFAQIQTTGVGGNWNDSGTWLGGVVPSSSDAVIILGGDTVFVDGTTNNASSITIDSDGELRFIGNGNTNVSLTVTNDLTITSTGKITSLSDGNSPTHTLNIGGDLTGTGSFDGYDVTGTFIGTVVDVVFNGTGTQTFDLSGSTIEFNALTISNTSAQVTATNSDYTVFSDYNINTSTDVVLGSGTITMEGGNFIVSTSTANFTPNSSTIEFIGSSNKEISIADNHSFNNIILNKSSGTFTLIGTGATRTFTINGTLTRTRGTITLASSSVAYNNASLVYNGILQQTAGVEWTTSLAPDNVTVNNSGGVLMGGSDLTSLSGSLTITNGSLDYTGTNNTLSVGGNVSGSGSFGADDDTLIVTGSSTTVTTSGTASISNLLISATGVSLANFTIEGRLRLDNAGTTKLTGGITLGNDAEIRVSQGTLDLNGQTVSKGTGTDLVLFSGTTLQTGGGTALSGFETYNLNANSTVNFDNVGNETVATGVSLNYGHVTIGGSGTKTVDNGNDFRFQDGGDLSVNAGILDLYNVTFNLTGTGHTLSLASSTTLQTGGTDITGFADYILTGEMVFNGDTDPETLPSGVTGDAFDLTVNKSGGNVVTQAATTIGGPGNTLKLTNGLIDVTSGNLTLAAGTAVSDGSGASYVDGTVLRTFNSSVEPGAVVRILPVGSGGVYRPIRLNFTGLSGIRTITGSQVESAPTGTLPGTVVAFATSLNRYYSLTASGAGIYTNYVVDLYYQDATDQESLLRIIKGTNGSSYTDAGTTTGYTDLVRINATYTFAEGFSDYAIARSGATITWDGSSGVNWGTAVNWVDGVLPRSGDDVLFDDSVLSGDYDVDYNTGTSEVEFNSITISPGASQSITLTLTKNTTMNLTAVGNSLTIGTGGTLIFNSTSVIMDGSAYDNSKTDFTTGNSTVQYNQPNSSNIQADTYYDLTLNLGTASSSNGLVTVNNNLVNQGSAAFTAGGNLTVAGTITNSGTFDMGISTYDIDVTGVTTNTGTVNLNGSANIVFTNTFNNNSSGLLSINSSNTVEFDGAFNNNGTATISVLGGTVNFDGTLILNGGTVTPNTDTHVRAALVGGGGNFSASSGTIQMDGPSTQTISGSTITFNNLTMANSNDLNLSTNITVEGALSFSADGLVNTGANTLTVGSGGTASGTANRYVNGIMAKDYSVSVSTQSFTFPAGAGGEYLPLTMQFATVTGSEVTVTAQQFNQDPHGVDPNINTTDLSKISNVRYWSLSQTGGSFTGPQLTLNYNLNDAVDTDASELRIAQLISVQWESIGGTGTAIGQGTITSSSMSVFGDGYVTFGDAAGGADNSLPVSLTSFTANADFSKVTLNWHTESEIDNQGFNIYRATGTNPENWVAINHELIPGAGNTSAKTEYSFVDQSIQSGETYYYQLESVSYNGVRELFVESTVTVLAPIPTEYALLNNYPNPFNPVTNLKFQLPDQSEVTVMIYDIQGHLVKKLLSKSIYSAGEHVVQWDASDQFGAKVSTGIYFYQFIAGNFQKYGKMMLIK